MLGEEERRPKGGRENRAGVGELVPALPLSCGPPFLAQCVSFYHRLAEQSQGITKPEKL